MSELNINGPKPWEEEGLTEKEIRELIRQEVETQTADQLSQELIKRLHFAIQKMEMYSSAHPMAIEAANQAYYFLTEFLNRQPTITLSLSKENKILADDVAIPDNYFTRRFAKDFDRHDIVSLTFYRDIEFREMMALVHFLERRIGVKTQKRDIEDYFTRERVTHIEANKIHYEMVHGNENDEESTRFFRKKKLGKLFEDYPEILKEILGSTKETGEGGTEQGGQKESVTVVPDTMLIDQVIHKFHERILNEEESDQDKLIRDIIDEIESSLSETEKERLRGRLEKIRDEMILDAESGASKMIDDSRKLRKMELFREFEEYIQLIKSGKKPEELSDRLKALFIKVFSEAELSEVNHIYELLQEAFTEDMNRALLSACPSFVDVLFDKCPKNIINSFVEDRMHDKKEEEEFTPRTPFTTETLFWILSNLAQLDRLMSSLQLLKLFEKKLSDEKTPEDLKSDAEEFMDEVTKSKILSSFVRDIDKYELDTPAELREIFRILDSERIAERVLERAGKKDIDYAVKAAKTLKVLQKKSSVVFAKYVREIQHINRGPLGELPDRETKHRAVAAIIALSIIAGDAGLSFLELNADDTDPDVCKATLDAISRIRSKRAVNFLVRYLYSHKNWEDSLEHFLVRMDKETAVPMLVKFFHLRKDKWSEIIRVVGKMGGDMARQFLLDTLDTWTFYTSALQPAEAEDFVLSLLDALNKFQPDKEMVRALKLFKSEWRNDDVIRSLTSIFRKEGDTVVRRINEILAEWKEELRGE